MADEENWGEGVIEIHNFNDHEFLVLFKDKDSNECQAVRAFVTHVKGVSYLNYQEIDMGKKNPWLFVRYHFSDNKMHLNIVEEDLLPGEITSSWKLRSSFKKHQLKKGFLDEEAIVLKRIPQPAESK